MTHFGSGGPSARGFMESLHRERNTRNASFCRMWENRAALWGPCRASASWDRWRELITLYTIPKKGNKISNWSSLKLLYTKPLINVLNDSFIKRTTLKQSSKSRIKLKRNKIPNITVEKKDQEALRRCKCTHGGSDLVSFSHTAQSRSFFSWIKNYAIYSDFKGDCTLLMNIRGHCSPACLWRTVKTGPRWYHSSADLLFWLWGEPPLSARWQGAVGARLLEKKPEQMFSGRCNDNWADCREQRRQDTLKRE